MELNWTWKCILHKNGILLDTIIFHFYKHRNLPFPHQRNHLTDLKLLLEETGSRMTLTWEVKIFAMKGSANGQFFLRYFSLKFNRGFTGFTINALLKASIIETIISTRLWHQLYFGMMKFRTHFISTKRGAFQNHGVKKYGFAFT